MDRNFSTLPIVIPFDDTRGIRVSRFRLICKIERPLDVDAEHAMGIETLGRTCTGWGLLVEQPRTILTSGHFHADHHKRSDAAGHQKRQRRTIKGVHVARD